MSWLYIGGHGLMQCTLWGIRRGVFQNVCVFMIVWPCLVAISIWQLLKGFLKQSIEHCGWICIEQELTSLLTYCISYQGSKHMISLFIWNKHELINRLTVKLSVWINITRWCLYWRILCIMDLDLGRVSSGWHAAYVARGLSPLVFIKVICFNDF